MDQRFGLVLQSWVNRGGATPRPSLGGQKSNGIRNGIVPWVFKQENRLPDRFGVGLLVNPMFNQHPIQHMVPSFQGSLRISVGAKPFG